MILRQLNLTPQMRLDLPHLRSIESAGASDFDSLAGKALAGKVPLILKGFTVSAGGTIGNPAQNLALNVAGGLMIHYGASESGSIFTVLDAQAAETLSATNSKVSGAFVAGVINYIGLDLARSADSTTSDLIQVYDPNSKTEVPQTAPLARILNYRIIVSTQNFTASTNVCPIAKITTDSNNNVVSITDSRNMMF